ncbi:Polygalacturonase QRT2 [Abeliophyllum distichum]|uniref:Polygalacturonase QRT2 n=1 Tax=Abeliophyllum distichum TaxID=126358 RepID=A0ABD1TFX3_9LAMI
MVFFVILLTILVSSPSCFSSDCRNLKNAEARRVNHQANKFRKLTKGMINSTRAVSIQTVNVDDFGAKADGRTDDSQAFQKAWDKACGSSQLSLILIPNRTYYMNPINLSGPCKSALKLEALTFSKCTNLRVTNLRITNPQQMHVNFQDCKNVEASNLTLTAPEKSPNTDGIHVSGTQNISIKNSVIKTGDDCISIVSGSRNVQATGIVCGPGHGISIGSLGKNGATDQVSNVSVNGATISGTTNGLRIKTWQKSAVQVENVMYKNIRGTSASEVAMKFDCSETIACKGIVLQNVNLTGQAGRIAKATCNNLKLDYRVASISPRCPLDQGKIDIALFVNINYLHEIRDLCSTYY